MSEAKHTPGPWNCENAQGIFRGMDGEIRVVAGEEDEILIADVLEPYAADAALANARLIAATPDLLAALENLLKDWRDHCDAGFLLDYSDYDMSLQEIAIARAKGAT